jgi:hypothetical protein
MTDHQHPITPPLELVDQWVNTCLDKTYVEVFTQIAQWGADQELEACCEWLQLNYNYPLVNHPLRVTRRAKPLTLKEQALGALGRFNTNAHTRADEMDQDFDLIRRALKALPHD